MPMVGDEVADLPSGDDEIADITAKAEDRVDPSVDAQPATDNTEVAAVTPRRVRTMVVRPDGSLVPREDPAPVAAAEPQAAAAAMMETAPAKPAAEPQVTNTTRPTAAPAAKQPAKAAASETPATAPVVPARPADQPVNVVGEVKPEQVAAVSQGASGGGWSMQIASQPSEDAAKSSYQDLARRYAGVLGGREATIVKAEVAGKG
ncbi:SPOR domain-containing protein, partial [Rhizobiaceae sp. 2RAB30]